MYEFINKLETFEKLLATSSLPGKYRELTNGGFIEIGTQRYYPFHSLIAALSEANKTKDENFIVQLDADLGNLKSVLPPIPANTISKELLKLANELDVLVHGDITDGEKRNHEGKAQKVMDALGTQNLIVTLPNGINKILRDYRTTKYIKDDAAELTESAGLGLLGPRRMVRRTKKGDTAGKGLAHNPTIKDSLRKRLENYAQNLEKRGLQDTSRYKYVQGALNLEGNAHIEPITTQDLRALFIDGVQNGKFSNISEGFGLRTPMNSQFSLDFYEVQGENQRQNTIKDVLIEGMLETNFVKVIPTKIVVASKKDQDLAEIPIAPKQRELKPIDRLRRELRISKDPISTILARYSAETITEFKGDKSPEAAAKAYQKATTKVDVFSSKNVHNIFQALYNTLSNPIASKEVIEEDIKVSLGVEGIGRDAGKLASRDFIRGSVLTKIFTGISHDDLFLLSDFARTDYYSSSKYAKSKEDFNDTLLEYIDTMNQDVFEVIDRFNQVIAAYNEITKDKIIPIKDISGVYERLQQIVLVSSSIREQERSTADFGIGLPEGYKAFAESLKAAKNEDTFNSILESPRNKDYKTTLEKEAGPHKDWDTAIDAVLERSLLKDSENIQDLGDNLSILEVAELINNITNPGVLGRIARVFSRKKNTELFNIIEYNRLQNSQGKDV